jgi:hypothetical protein
MAKESMKAREVKRKNGKYAEKRKALLEGWRFRRLQNYLKMLQFVCTM